MSFLYAVVIYGALVQIYGAKLPIYRTCKYYFFKLNLRSDNGCDKF